MKLYRFEYSCYARKVQMVLDLLGAAYEVIDVPYGDRAELAGLTGGYIQVPVLVDDAARVRVDSRAICVALLAGKHGQILVPPPEDGPIWAYADWCDGPLEDVLFRLAAPGVRRRFVRPVDRGLFTLIKERKFGRGCVDQWEERAQSLLAEARDMLLPTARTLVQRPFIFGDRPTLADAALYGQCAMLHYADSRLPDAMVPLLSAWMARLEEAAQSRRWC